MSIIITENELQDLYTKLPLADKYQLGSDSRVLNYDLFKLIIGKISNMSFEMGRISNAEDIEQLLDTLQN